MLSKFCTEWAMEATNRKDLWHFFTAMLLRRWPLYQCHVCKSYYYFISIPSNLSGDGFLASDEVRARPEGQPVTIRTRSLLFIRLYLFSDLLTNWKS